MKKNTTKIFIAAVFLTISGTAFAQEGRVGINTPTPAATLDVVASPSIPTRIDGLIAPRLKGSELKSKNNLYTADQDGAIVYVTEAVSGVTDDKTTNVTSIGYYYFDKTVGTAGRWMKIANPTAVGAYKEPWNQAGTSTPADANNQDIYQIGAVSIWRNKVFESTVSGSAKVDLHVNGATRIGATDRDPDVTKKVGASSFAGGNAPVASGNNAMAYGTSVEASGDSSSAFGNATGAAADNSAAFGFKTISTGINSLSIGANTGAMGAQSFAGGSNSTASGENSLAMGNNTKATGTESFAIGNNTTAAGAQSFAGGGNGSTATGQYAFAFGNNAQAKANHAVAMGVGTVAPARSSATFGRYNVNTFPTANPAENLPGDPIFQVGSGPDDARRYNIITTFLGTNGTTGVGGGWMAIGGDLNTMPVKVQDETLRVYGGALANKAYVTDINSVTGAATDKLVVADPTTGQLKTITSSSIAPTITADNGLNKTGNNVQLGGNLVKATSIGTNSAVTLGITGLQTGAVTDKIVVASGDEGVLKAIAISSLPNSTYQEPWNNAADGKPATTNGQAIYQNGAVSIWRNKVFESTASGSAKVDLHVNGATRIGATDPAATKNVGANSFAGGSAPVASGNNAMAYGTSVEASGDSSSAFGNATGAMGSNSIAMGDQSTAVAENSAAFGFQTTSSAINSLSIGNNTTAMGAQSVAGGISSIALGDNSTAFGNKSKAAGTESFAIGNNTTAAGAQSFAGGGSGSTATGQYAFAFGSNAQAKANHAVAMGVGTVAPARSSVTLGRFNVNTFTSPDIAQNSPGDPIFQVGSGPDDARRYNIITTFLGTNGTTGTGGGWMAVGGDINTMPTKVQDETLRVYGGALANKAYVTDINSVAGAVTDKIVVADPTTGQLKTITSSSIAPTITADNGLTKTGNNVQLGGNLVKPTSIGTNGTVTLALTGLENTGTTSDKIIVSSNNGVLKTIDAATADNGLTKTGNNVQLGGNLVKPTSIGTNGTVTLALTGLENTGTTSDKIIVSSNNGVLKTIAASSLPNATYQEPWNNVADGTPATSNTASIYQLGKVGIGTNSPLSRLHLGGENTPTLTIRGEGDGNTDSYPQGSIRFLESGATNWGMNINFQSPSHSNSDYYNSIRFQNNDGGTLSDLVTINSYGNVGIGTIHPSNKLHIASTSNPVKLEGLQTGASTDQIVTVDADGVLKKVTSSSLPNSAYKEPWKNQADETDATTDTQNIYQRAAVAIMKKKSYSNGNWANLDVNGAVRFGTNPTGAVGDNSAAFGNTAEASGIESFAAGSTTKASGVRSFATGWETKVTGDNSAGFGKSNTVSGVNSVAMGNGSKVETNQSFAGGSGSTVIYSDDNTGDNSIAFGDEAHAVAASSAAFGKKTIAGGEQSLAFGNGAWATGDYSLAGGQGTKAIGTNSVAFGNGSYAQGKNSFAFTDGLVNQGAVGDYSFAFGNRASTRYNHGVAMGIGTVSPVRSGVTFGRFNSYTGATQVDGTPGGSNAHNSPGDPIFQVGQGGDDNGRSNIITGFSGTSTGNAYAPGWVVIGSQTTSTTIGGINLFLSPRLGTATLSVLGSFAAQGSITASGAVNANTPTFPDYVFEKYYTGTSNLNKDYQFNTLYETEKFIKEHKHLPGINSVSELEKTETGYSIDLGKTTTQTLEKVEELYLHTIEQQKQIDELKDIVKQQQKQIDQLLKK